MAQERVLVLVVEDDVDVGGMLLQLLELAGFGTMLARTGAEGLAFLEEVASLPDVIVLDMRMPVMDGLTFYRLLLERPLWHDIPVILLSADHTLKLVDTDSPPLLVMRKPFDPPALLDAVARLARGGAERQR